MSDDVQRNETEAESSAPAASEDAAAPDSKEPPQPAKVKINYEASMPRSEAVSYFEAIIGGLRSGRLEFRQDGDALVLAPPEQLEVEVKAQRKGDKAKIVFEIEWRDAGPALEILN